MILAPNPVLISCWYISFADQPLKGTLVATEIRSDLYSLAPRGSSSPSVLFSSTPYAPIRGRGQPARHSFSVGGTTSTRTKAKQVSGARQNRLATAEAFQHKSTVCGLNGSPRASRHLARRLPFKSSDQSR